MNPHQRRALARLAARLHAEAIPFALGGSALLHVLGLTDEVGDLDLMLGPDDHDRLRAAAGGWWSGSRHGGEGIWRSAWLAWLALDGVQVDAIGGFAFVIDGREVRLPLRAAGDAEVNGVTVPLADPALWWVAYAAYKPAKAALLEAVVTPTARAAVRRELGLDE
ncbi:MAG: hypothetical protein H0V93_01070 [Euzebyales bacterium]|nr:hypothetical protein [Euzebyales bacterium]